MSCLYNSFKKVTLGNILISIKETPFTSSRMNLPLPLSTARHTKLSGSKWKQRRGVPNLNHFMSEKPTTTGYTESTSCFKAAISIFPRNKNAGDKELLFSTFTEVRFQRYLEDNINCVKIPVCFSSHFARWAHFTNSLRISHVFSKFLFKTIQPVPFFSRFFPPSALF